MKIIKCGDIYEITDMKGRSMYITPEEMRPLANSLLLVSAEHDYEASTGRGRLHNMVDCPVCSKEERGIDPLIQEQNLKDNFLERAKDK